ncbi:MAG: PQQ-dependent sugar dehydrogenase [Thermoflexales bacterium]|nr:PQQ-dependent sugar dehydrogenase [Thermoflexales bacterium]
MPALAATAEPAPQATPQPLRPALMLLVSGLQRPVGLAHAGDPSLLYVLEQPGRVRVIRDGQLLERPFLDLTDRVGARANEQGLLGIAFAPDFAQSRKVFLNYTDRRGDTVIAGFLASPDGLTADPASEWTVLRIDQPYANHNGGQIAFGPDGMLYIGMGDGGSGGDPQNFAQNRASLLGKMLRIDVSASSPSAPYRIPPDNPDFGAQARPELWAIGLRNPWRFSFDRLTGDLYIADVGQNRFEEINFQPAGSRGGQNYGWRLREGFERFAGESAEPLTDPIWQYGREEGCSVTGGYVYRGSGLPDLFGAYLYGDYCAGTIWALQRGEDGVWRNRVVLRTELRISSFGEDAAGELYVIDHQGAVYRLVGQPT